ncbi:Copper transporter MctB precursor [Corynebacterium occultum]|uniref:Copper transporter MctB n=1 Tax=Corynebacterium occultum TaxID=2675219 RepID=A0A6B8VT25_9CORY|nr:copper transporter [Corynebacterium occultum]QGU07293.1 Copper transporter MctB precursor [Corynebacterium occultum]
MAKNKRPGLAGIILAGLTFGLAGGVTLGTLVIAPNMPDQADSQQVGEVDPLVAEINAAQADTADAFIAEQAEELVAGSLAQRPVLVMHDADADEEDLGNVIWLLHKAGAVDAGRIKLNAQFFSQDGADQLKSIVANTLPAGAQLSEDALDPGTHAGNALGAALLLDPGTAEPMATPEERALLLESLKGSGYLDYEQGTILPAQTIVLITGGNDGSGEGAFAAQNLANFAISLDEAGNGAVLAGRITAASDTGAIALTREWAADRVSTVDSLSRTYGRMATVLAVREQLDGGSGSYGSAASATDGAAPEVPAD